MNVDLAVDNGDNSITVTGHTDDGTIYTTSAGRVTDLPSSKPDQLTYYVDLLNTCLPPEQPVLYQNPDYTPDDDNSEPEN